ncbi:MAG: type II secretion system protein [Acidobacteriota bacterium]|nr:type II secretion system GspH family protein [Blastocatellia bacterium]MDW8411683.1 type II secretion system protein [Acidobacteriota bacterium]
MQTGYSLIEILLVIAVIAISAVAVTVNMTRGKLSFDARKVAAQIVNSLSVARREALSGSSSIEARTFDISYLPDTPGIKIVTRLPNSNCRLDCLCIGEMTFCYRPQKSVTFEVYSGKLADNHAFFVVSDQRSFAVLVSKEGYMQIAELDGGF